MGRCQTRGRRGVGCGRASQAHRAARRLRGHDRSWQHTSVAGLYEASRDHAPVLALSGDMPRPMHGTDFIQTTEPDLLFRDVSLYTETISSPAQAAAVIHQAIAAAYAGPGVAHLTLPQDVLSAKAVGAASRNRAAK